LGDIVEDEFALLHDELFTERDADFSSKYAPPF